jgi:hypothetical protein
MTNDENQPPPSPPQTPARAYDPARRDGQPRVPLGELPCFPWDLFVNLVEPLTKDYDTIKDMTDWSEDRLQEAQDDANDLYEMAIVQIADATLRDGVKGALVAYREMVKRAVVAMQQKRLLEQQKAVVKERMADCMRMYADVGGPSLN